MPPTASPLCPVGCAWQLQYIYKFTLGSDFLISSLIAYRGQGFWQSWPWLQLQVQHRKWYCKVCLKYMCHEKLEALPRLCHTHLWPLLCHKQWDLGVRPGLSLRLRVKNSSKPSPGRKSLDVNWFQHFAFNSSCRFCVSSCRHSAM